MPDSLVSIRRDWEKCTQCTIGKWAHKHVIGTGKLAAKFMFVGEGPGVSEDALGEPFIGASGQLLREALDFAGFEGNYFLTNLVACRPCDKASGPNRAPTEKEVLRCESRLQRVYEVIRPKVVVAVGKVPMQFLEKYHSKWNSVPIYHPAYILRNGGRRAEAYKDWVKSMVRIREDF